jgi:hypothetical protein
MKGYVDKSARLHRGGRGFESLIAHQLAGLSNLDSTVAPSGTETPPDGREKLGGVERLLEELLALFRIQVLTKSSVMFATCGSVDASTNIDC